MKILLFLLLVWLSIAVSAESVDICALHPEILACQEMGTGDEVGEVEVVGVVRTVGFNQERAEAGSCPAPMGINLQAGMYEWEWQPICDFAEGMRPFVIVAATVSVGFFIFGAMREN